ncbi:MAG TPA: hypothetical protein PKY35_13890 [Candidatus Hydrogenedentes bacterium]|nr:hypothetical protein [Candidatus Hydrogenedentota bacterium]HOL78111.1 hypothetical protein [Candidatus Hydrogenedentota bacterium]HPO86480.1 hypothetical protein [Candidatus Hydrogenedentota bacterium]
MKSEVNQGVARTRRRAWRAIVIILGVVAALGITSAVQMQLDAIGKTKRDEELLYLPNEKLLNHFTAGLHSVVADLLWLKCVQYTVQEFHSQERKFTWLEHMCNTIVRLDPYFTGAYQWGGTLLAAIGNDTAAIELVKRGMVRRPDRWELPFEVAKTFILNRREEPGAAAIASYYLLWTADLLEGADREFFTRWAYNIQRMHDLSGTGRQIWVNIRETTKDPFMRELAERKIALLDVREKCAGLNLAVERFVQKYGRRPGRLEELSEKGVVDTIPSDPLGGMFFVADDGKVYNTSVLDEDVADRLRVIRAAINRFKNEKGRYPERLEELVESGEMTRLPSHPYPGRAWRYDPIQGSVE